MAWAFQNNSNVPQVDSSNSEIINSGLKEYLGKQGEPMINSIVLNVLKLLN